MALSLEQYVESEMVRLKEFAENWKKQNKLNPEYYPMQMEDGNEGSWDEMFFLFKSSV